MRTILRCPRARALGEPNVLREVLFVADIDDFDDSEHIAIRLGEVVVRVSEELDEVDVRFEISSKDFEHTSSTQLFTDRLWMDIYGVMEELRKYAGQVFEIDL